MHAKANVQMVGAYLGKVDMSTLLLGPVWSHEPNGPQVVWVKMYSPAGCKTIQIVTLSVMSMLLFICINRRVPVVVVMICWEMYGDVVEVLIRFKL